jgi:hypothetical protein
MIVYGQQPKDNKPPPFRSKDSWTKTAGQRQLLVWLAHIRGTRVATSLVKTNVSSTSGEGFPLRDGSKTGRKHWATVMRAPETAPIGLCQSRFVSIILLEKKVNLSLGSVSARRGYRYFDVVPHGRRVTKLWHFVAPVGEARTYARFFITVAVGGHTSYFVLFHTVDA